MHISHEMVRDGIPTIIETRGDDFVYQIHSGSGATCMYVWEGEPDCLIGCFLADLGLPLEAFNDHEGSEIETAVEKGLLSDNGFTIDPEALHLLGKLQYWQDAHEPWGVAYERALYSINN